MHCGGSGEAIYFTVLTYSAKAVTAAARVASWRHSEETGDELRAMIERKGSSV